MTNRARTRNKTVFIIGCGGTGSWFVRHLLKEPDLFEKEFTFYLFDHDIVEEKNLVRQDFTEDDVGRHKAVVMAEKLLDVGIDAKPIIDWRNLKFDVAPEFVFLFVDNMVGRNFYFRKIFQQARNSIELWLDSGNGLKDGQIFMLSGKSTEYDIGMYKSFLQTALTDELSRPCAENIQSVTINFLMSFASYKFFKEVAFEGREVPRFFRVDETGDNLGAEKEFTQIGVIANVVLGFDSYEKMRRLYRKQADVVEHYVPFVKENVVFSFLVSSKFVKGKVPSNVFWRPEKQVDFLYDGKRLVVAPNRKIYNYEKYVPVPAVYKYFTKQPFGKKIENFYYRFLEASKHFSRSQIKNQKPKFEVLSATEALKVLLQQRNKKRKKFETGRTVIKANWEDEDYMNNIFFLKNL